MKYSLSAFLVVVVTALQLHAQKGDSTALQLAEKMMLRLGGHQAWAAASHMYVKEKIQRNNIATDIIGEFWRDFTKPGYAEKMTGNGIDFVETRNATQGVTINKGVVSKMSETDLVEEWKGSQQEPYQIYQRLGRRDSNLVVRSVDPYRLDFYEKNGRHLCWILINANAEPVSWGNIYRLRLNQHFYGPLKSFGIINMPAWGVSIDARFRFEYVEIVMKKEPLVLHGL